MTCNDIQNQLPSYEEGVLSPEDARRIATHLASCGSCQKALAELKQANLLVRGLKDVEPPADFNQTIMSRVRQEAAQRQRFWRKFFFPLSIKIPVQAFALVAISVLAFYVYQKDTPHLGDQGLSLPVAPEWETAPRKAIPSPPAALRQKGVPQGLPASGEPSAITAEAPGSMDRAVPDAKVAASAGGNSLPTTAEKKEEAEENALPPVVGGSGLPEGMTDRGFAVAAKEKGAMGTLSRDLPNEASPVCETDVCRKPMAEIETTERSADVTVKSAPEAYRSFMLKVRNSDAALTAMQDYSRTHLPVPMKVFIQEGKPICLIRMSVAEQDAFLAELRRIGDLQAVDPSPSSETPAWVDMKIMIITYDDKNP